MAWLVKLYYDALFRQLTVGQAWMVSSYSVPTSLRSVINFCQMVGTEAK